MIVREATVGDLGRMGEWAEEFRKSSAFIGEFDLDKFCGTWTRLIESGTGKVFIHEEGTRVVGAIGGVIYPEPYSDHEVATEFFWFVMPKYRGTGMDLYRRFEAWAQKKRTRQIRMVHLLDVMPERVRSLYLHLGYKPAEVHYVKDLMP